MDTSAECFLANRKPSGWLKDTRVESSALVFYYICHAYKFLVFPSKSKGNWLKRGHVSIQISFYKLGNVQGTPQPQPPSAPRSLCGNQRGAAPRLRHDATSKRKRRRTAQKKRCGSERWKKRKRKRSRETLYTPNRSADDGKRLCEP